MQGENEIQMNPADEKKLHRDIALLNLNDERAVEEAIANIDWRFTNDDTLYLTHGIHPYPAKFIPQIASTLIRLLCRPGDTVWDPFCGSGTTGLEAILAGRNSINSDVNPLSKIIGEVKTMRLSSAIREELAILDEKINLVLGQETIDRKVSATGVISEAKIPDIPNTDKWFHKNAAAELAIIREFIIKMKSPQARNIAYVALSRIVVRVSNQEEETRYAAISKVIPKEFTLDLFLDNLECVLSRLAQLEPKLGKQQAVFFTDDLRSPIVGANNNQPVKENSVDLVVTSPPYPNATDYHLYNKFRLYWLGFDPAELAKKEIGSHLRHQKEKTGFSQYIEEMKLCMTNIFKALKPGKYAAIVVGDAIFEKQLFNTAEELSKAANEIGFKTITIVQRPIHATRRSFVKPGRRAKSEKILILRKPYELIVTLEKPNYNLWEYEQHLREKETSKIVSSDSISRSGKDLVVTLKQPSDMSKLQRLAFSSSVVFNGSKISTWQGLLENGYNHNGSSLSARKESKYVTHGLHPYKGKFYPQLVKSLLNIGEVQEGARILDPFCGSGTVILEGYLNGFESYGCDFNPLATEITRAKVGVLSVEPDEFRNVVEEFIAKLTKIHATKNGIQSFPEVCREEISRWFPMKVIDKLSTVLTLIGTVSDPIIRQFLQVVLSSIIRNVSQQDPRDLRVRKRKDLISDAPLFEQYSEAINQQFKKIMKFHSVTSHYFGKFLPPTIWNGDSRNLTEFHKHGLHSGDVDAVITSPPYATALPYIDTDRLSLLTVFNIDSLHRSQIEEEIIGSREIAESSKSYLEERIKRNDFDQILSGKALSIIRKVNRLNTNSSVGFRRQNMASLLYRYFNDLTKVMSNLDKLVVSNGNIFIIIGDNYTIAGGSKVIIETADVIEETGQKMGWIMQNNIPITVTTEGMKHIKNSIRKNVILHFTKA